MRYFVVVTALLACCLVAPIGAQRATPPPLPEPTSQARRPSRASAPRPHIVILLADDLGWQDVGYHGSEIRTPRIDALAAKGVRLEQFYVQPSCSPTRSSLMTGRYPFRQGLDVGSLRYGEHDEMKRLFRRGRRGLPLEERTLAEALRGAGYVTAILGKWHLGQLQSEGLPLARGFDQQYGLYGAEIDYFTHRRGTRLDWYRDGEQVVEEGYATDLIAREAERLIAAHDPAVPLFLYVAFNAPHAPLQAPKPYLDSYPTGGDPRRRTYAAMVTCLDDAVGRIVVALAARGMSDDTLLLIASDNGALPSAGGDNGPLRGGKGTFYEGGLRVPAIAVWPGELAPGRSLDAPLHIVDWYPTLLELAGASLQQPLALDGVGVWPTLSAGSPSPRSEIVYGIAPGRRAIRRGAWKLIEDDAEGVARAQLFDISRDPGELVDLAEARPDMVDELRAQLERYRREAL